jgi:hypothetical protein
MTRFDFYRTPEAPPRRRPTHSMLWATLCVLLEISVLLWLWVELAP